VQVIVVLDNTIGFVGKITLPSLLKTGVEGL